LQEAVGRHQYGQVTHLCSYYSIWQNSQSKATRTRVEARLRQLRHAEPAASILNDVVPAFYGTCHERPSLAAELN